MMRRLAGLCVSIVLFACGEEFVDHSGVLLDGAIRSDGGLEDLAVGVLSDGAVDLALPPTGVLTPARGGSSAGSGGGPTGGIAVRTVGAVTYRLIVPAAYSDATKAPLLVVYSGTERGTVMANNLVSLAGPVPSSASYIRAVLDGVDYNGDGGAGAAVLDEVRARYNVDNDRTYLLGESAGTTAAEQLGFHLRQSYFAAYWANDVAAASADGPAQTAAQLGFAPFGQVGPGGAAALAGAIATNMKNAGYRTDPVTPYAGSGSGMHGSPDQFIAALSWFGGKLR